jgi:hypothetical protein
MMVNEMVQIHDGYSRDIFVHERFITGIIVRINKKSIRVHMTHAKCTENGKITCEYEMNQTATFTFWKTIENAGKTVDLYKNKVYGIIEIVH